MAPRPNRHNNDTAATEPTQQTKNGHPFPVNSLAEAIPELRRPFALAAVRFRPVPTRDGRTIAIAFINGRAVSERLNLVCPTLWSETFESEGVPQKHLVCHLTIDKVTHTDVGRESAGVDGVKGMYSDARKRAAVHFGVASYLDGLPKCYLNEGEYAQTNRRGKDSESFLTDVGLKRVQAEYEKWLKEIGIKQYGEPLNHGGSPEAIGDYEAGEHQQLAGADGGGQGSDTRTGHRPLTEDQEQKLTAAVAGYVKAAGEDGLEPLVEMLIFLGVDPEKDDHGDDPAAWAITLPPLPAANLFKWLGEQTRALTAPDTAGTASPPPGKIAVPVPEPHPATVATVATEAQAAEAAAADTAANQGVAAIPGAGEAPEVAEATRAAETATAAPPEAS